MRDAEDTQNITTASALASLSLAGRLVVALVRKGTITVEESDAIFEAAVAEQEAIGSLDNRIAAAILREYAQSVRRVSARH